MGSVLVESAEPSCGHLRNAEGIVLELFDGAMPNLIQAEGAKGSCRAIWMVQDDVLVEEGILSEGGDGNDGLVVHRKGHHLELDLVVGDEDQVDLVDLGKGQEYQRRIACSVFGDHHSTLAEAIGCTVIGELLQEQLHRRPVLRLLKAIGLLTQDRVDLLHDQDGLVSSIWARFPEGGPFVGGVEGTDEVFVDDDLLFPASEKAWAGDVT